MRKVVQGDASPTADNATVSAPNHRSRVSLTVFLRSTTFSRYDIRSAITGPTSIPIALQGSNSELCRTASAAATAVFNMLILVSEKKFLCVNRGWRTKSWTPSHCRIHLLMIDSSPIERHSEDKMQLWRTPHHRCCQVKDLETTNA